MYAQTCADDSPFSASVCPNAKNVCRFCANDYPF